MAISYTLVAFFLFPMAVYAVKRSNESNEKLAARFKKQFQQTRMLQELRGKAHHSRALTKRKVRIAAVKREQYRAVRAKAEFYA